MAIYSKAKKLYSKGKKAIKKTAKTYLKYRRSGTAKRYFKGGMVSSTAIAKSLANLSFKAGATSEYKMLDIAHNTTGVAGDAGIRYWYNIAAGSLEATESNSGAAGTSGYLLRAISHPNQGDTLTTRDGMRYGVASIQWKGLVSLVKDSNQYNTNGAIRLMIVAHYKPEDTFTMSEFLQTDTNGEYSIQSRREEDHYKDFRVIASKIIKLGVNQSTRSHFNIVARPKQIIKMLPTSSKNVSYYCVAVASSDIGNHNTNILYNGSVRMRFIA